MEPEVRERGIRAIAADYLRLRSPTKLIVDGALLLLLNVLLDHVVRAWGFPEVYDPKVFSFLERLFRLWNLAWFMEYAAYYLGLVLVATGCARLIAEAIKASRSGGS